MEEMIQEMVIISKKDYAKLLKSVEAKNETVIEDRNIGPQEKKTQYIHGIEGLASFLGVSYPTAWRFKNAGFFPVYQRGRIFLFIADEVLAGMKKKKR